VINLLCWMGLKRLCTYKCLQLCLLRVAFFVFSYDLVPEPQQTLYLSRESILVFDYTIYVPYFDLPSAIVASFAVLSNALYALNRVYS
jgi:hypothetical protein